ITADPEPGYIAVKESVLPFNRFLGGDILLGPEMKSTGEVMGIDTDLGVAFAKSQIAARQSLPLGGKVFISVKDYDKEEIAAVGKGFYDMGFEILSTPGTAQFLGDHGIPVTRLSRIGEGRPNLLDYIKNKDVGLLINTPSGPKPRRDEVVIRSTAISHGIPVVTTVSGAVAVIGGIRALKQGTFGIRSLQEIYST
ncbi:MAG: carbamoyl phosphate synthase large subunit, partial [Deltaproteobacteria bacterium]|nr:carbamoyl phosphate synthase large subunit [Deltaproteobacteria bacterium]